MNSWREREIIAKLIQYTMQLNNLDVVDIVFDGADGKENEYISQEIKVYIYRYEESDRAIENLETLSCALSSIINVAKSRLKIINLGNYIGSWLLIALIKESGPTTHDRIVNFLKEMGLETKLLEEAVKRKLSSLRKHGIIQWAMPGHGYALTRKGLALVGGRRSETGPDIKRVMWLGRRWEKENIDGKDVESERSEG